MNKYICFLIFILLMGCVKHPLYKEGDCYKMSRDCEKWEKYCTNYISIVLEVGKEKYHTFYSLFYSENNNIVSNYTVAYDDENIKWVDDDDERVNCPKVLKDKYTEYKKK